jgi:uncharacterized protein (DUF2461 family)
MTDTTDAERTPFPGWPPDGPAFLAELADDNTREFWTANAHRFRAALLEPMRALAGELAGEFGRARVFRPYVDRRFRPRAEPYRTDAGLTASGPGGTPYAIVLSATGLAVQVGYQLFDAGQLRRYRAALNGPPGAGLTATLDALQFVGLVPDGVPALVGRPRGCPPDHPLLHLLRLRGLHVDRSWPAGAWLGTGDVVLQRVRGAWRAARPLAAWLDVHVGPRDEPGATPIRPSSNRTADEDDATADQESAHSTPRGGGSSV